ncbi:MAG: helix-turn-helix domain-containing protein [Pseudonocardiaceae bacterium]
MDKETAPEGTVGRRVAIQRKLAGLTQHQLATRAHVSKSLVAQVETGALPASAAFTAAAARALHVEVDALTGEPYGPPLTDPQADHAGIPELRVVLGRDEEPELGGPPMTADELRARLDQCQAHREKSRYSTLVTALPELLNHAFAIVAQARPGAETETAWALLDDAYELADTACTKFGYYDLGALAARCGRGAAAKAGTPLRAAAATCRYLSVQFHRGDHTGILRATARGHALLDGERSPVAQAVRVVLHLRQSAVHAQLGALDRADEHLDEARRLVAPGVPAHPFYGMNANPANIDIHYVGAPLQISDGAMAVARAEQVQLPSDTKPSRVGHHWINVARAWTLHGDRAKALGALKQARAAAPQQTRYGSSVHETVRILAEHDRRANDTLAGFARWLGMTL